ncbi:MAG: hypothetical protein N2663_07100 [Chlorobi bacterium]|nr:hypothetical protein [Chlorobiota bacterium]
MTNLLEGERVRWWGIGRGYFRNAMAVVMLLMLAGTLVLLLVLRQTLHPLMITTRSGDSPPPLSERVLHASDAQAYKPTLGEWLVFAAVCDSCIAAARVRLDTSNTTCERATQLYRHVQRQLATELNRYGWSVVEFRTYERIALALQHDSIPKGFRWIRQCFQVPRSLISDNRTSHLDSIAEQHVKQLLRGRLWWIELGLSSDLDHAATHGIAN